MDTELEHHKNLVYQKIGRNVVLFQKIEYILKYLAANAKIEGYAGEIQAIAEQQAASMNTQTMGQAVGRFIETIYTESEHLTNEPDNLKEPWFTLGFTIQGEGLYEKCKEALASVVAERNALIHHFITRWDWETIDSYKEAEAYLDCQYDKIVIELEDLRKTTKTFEEQRKALAKYIRSDAYKQHNHVLKLRQSQPVVSLGKISRQVARQDGWMVLGTATRHLSKAVREKVAVLKRQHGYKTLQDIMLATELFDFREETAEKGGIRVLYRVKPEYSAWVID
jgi:hypothetical protein